LNLSSNGSRSRRFPANFFRAVKTKTLANIALRYPAAAALLLIGILAAFTASIRLFQTAMAIWEQQPARRPLLCRRWRSLPAAIRPEKPPARPT
jgi:hypothetical protein